MTAHRVNFVDFHDSFSPKSNSVLNNLLPHFNMELSDDPEFLFYSVFGFNHALPRFNRCIRIWCTEENFRPDFTRCDYTLSFDCLPHEPRNLRLPLYVRYLYHHHQRTGRNLIKQPNFDATSILRTKTRFCNFIYSNPGARTRIEFFLKLSKYKRVDSGGAILNNLGYRPSDKLKFIAPYKFTIAFENSSWPGYVTEKLVEPMLVDSLPVYWGHPSVNKEFNPRSFINCHNFASLDDAVAEIIRLDQDDQAYIDRLNQPWFEGNTENECCKPDYLVPFFTRVFADKPHDWDKWANVKPINYATEHRAFM